jgi:hypothetical protein
MTTPTATKPADPLALLRTRRYVALLVLAAILGVPIAAIAYLFLKLVDVLQNAVFTQLPSGLGFGGEPLWWPLLPLTLAGLLATLLLASDGLAVTPLVIVAVVIAYIITVRISPPADSKPGPAAAPAGS